MFYSGVKGTRTPNNFSFLWPLGPRLPADRHDSTPDSRRSCATGWGQKCTLGESARRRDAQTTPLSNLRGDPRHSGCYELW
jgi:hypothetical protein